MKCQHVFITFIFTAICVICAFAQQAPQEQQNNQVNDYIVQGYQFASASKGFVSSPTMGVVQDGGTFEKLEGNDSISLLRIAPGDFWDCRFKLPETAFDVKVVITYRSQNANVKGRIRWNKSLLPEDKAVLLKGEKDGLVVKEISLEEFQRENELRIFSVSEPLQILNVKILYSYRMPSCTVGNVTVKLLSPDSDKDVLGSDLKIEWAGTGSCEKGWVTLKYKDGKEWKTVPGAESFDLGDEAWKEKSHGQFVWKDHGLKAFPELKIEYKEGESPKRKKARLATEAKAKAEQEERERKTQFDKIANEAQRLLQNKQYDEALAKIDEVLKMYPNNDDYKQTKQRIEAAKDPFSHEGRKAGDRAVKVINGVDFAFKWCPPGTYTMGSPKTESDRSNNEIQHEVTLTKGFWMMETEVSQKQWKAVMGDNPSNYEGDDLPVESVSWNDCQEFCKKCTQLGFPVQLPMEAQWEYACRAGTKGMFAGNLDEMAWYSSNSEDESHPVGTKKPNAWGLYDMHGNVWEWCTDPLGSLRDSYRTIRGGSWFSNAQSCRSAYRGSFVSSARNRYNGFRVVKVYNPSEK